MAEASFRLPVYHVLVYDYQVLFRVGGKWSTETENKPLAYLTYQGEGACVHHVEAESGPAAKREAIRRHLAGIASGACKERKDAR
jgi:hypothetical protein